jgi:hypothetical protein
MLTAGSLAIPGIYIGKPAVLVPANGGEAETVNIFRSLFDQYRQLGQVTGPELLVPTLVAQTHALQELAKAASPQARKQLLILGSRYAEYVGWLIQETGNDLAALWWTRRAVDLAAAGGDSGFATYGLVRHALVTLYRDDAEQTVQLARQAQTGSVSPRIRGLAVLREAQGHALAADYNACMAALDRASTLLDHAVAEAGQPVIGTKNLSDPAEMIKGWCLYDLGRPHAAAQVIDRQLATVPAQAARTTVRYGTRRALAYAATGEVEHACRLTAEMLDSATRLDSATIAKDLRALGRTLGRHPKNPSVRELAPRLGSALRTAGL